MMTFKQIAEQLTLEDTTGKVFTENQVKKICYKAIAKLAKSKILKEYYN